jgi:hypothetical protein
MASDSASRRRRPVPSRDAASTSKHGHVVTARRRAGWPRARAANGRRPHAQGAKARGRVPPAPRGRRREAPPRLMKYSRFGTHTALLLALLLCPAAVPCCCRGLHGGQSQGVSAVAAGWLLVRLRVLLQLWSDIRTAHRGPLVGSRCKWLLRTPAQGRRRCEVRWDGDRSRGCERRDRLVPAVLFKLLSV